jgi:hypothetical protein
MSDRRIVPLSVDHDARVMDVSRIVHRAINIFLLARIDLFLSTSMSCQTFSGAKSVARKYKGNLNGERYVANTSPYEHEVHDLDNENLNCMVDHIIRSHQDRPFESLEDARREEFVECPFCCAVIDNSMADVDPQTNALAGIKSRRVA